MARTSRALRPSAECPATARTSNASFGLALGVVGEADAKPLDGWDVTFGNGNAFANVEYAITTREAITAKLRVRAKATTATTSVRPHLFEPYE